MGRARPSVCAFDCVGMKICWTARTAVARAWDGRLRARPSSAFDCMGMGIRGTARTVSRMRGTVDCLSSARVRLRLLVCALRSTATARLRSAFDCDCTSACARLRPHVCVRSTATACLRSAFDCDCTSCGYEKHGHEKGALRSVEQRLLVCVCVFALYGYAGRLRCRQCCCACPRLCGT